MLVLTRLVGESIVIGDPKNPIAVVSIQRVEPGRVSLGIVADRSIPINRDELVKKTER